MMFFYPFLFRRLLISLNLSSVQLLKLFILIIIILIAVARVSSRQKLFLFSKNVKYSGVTKHFFVIINVPQFPRNRRRSEKNERSVLGGGESLEVGDTLLEGVLLLLGGDAALHVLDDPVHHLLLLDAADNVRHLELVIEAAADLKFAEKNEEN